MSTQTFMSHYLFIYFNLLIQCLISAHILMAALVSGVTAVNYMQPDRQPEDGARFLSNENAAV